MSIENLNEVREYVTMFKELGVKSFSCVSTGIAVEFFEKSKKELPEDLDKEIEDFKFKFGGLTDQEIKEFV